MTLKKDGTATKPRGGNNKTGQPKKPESEKKAKPYVFRPSPKVAAILDSQEKKTALIEFAVLTCDLQEFEKHLAAKKLKPCNN